MNTLVDMSVIKETRQLVLPLQTVLDAVVQYDRRSHGPLSRGEVLQAEFVRGVADAGMDVAVRMHDEEVIEWRHFNIDELAAAIINYCRAKKIPLPYAGSKKLEITQQGAALSIDNTVNIAQRTGPGTDLSGQPLRYAKGYEPHALMPSSRGEIAV